VTQYTSQIDECSDDSQTHLSEAEPHIAYTQLGGAEADEGRGLRPDEYEDDVGQDHAALEMKFVSSSAYLSAVLDADQDGSGVHLPLLDGVE
jgi:hypothetical protein